MLDFELVNSAREALNSLDDAICVYFETGKQTPYSPNASLAALKEVRSRAARVRPLITTRLDAMAQQYLRTVRGDWQKPFLDELLAIDCLSHPELGEKCFRQLRSRLTGLCDLCELIGNDNDIAGRLESSKQEAFSGSVEKESGEATNSTVDSRMWRKWQDDPVTIDWTKKQWASFLGCGETTVQDSPTWKKIMHHRRLNGAARAASAADHKVDRRRVTKERC